MKSGGLQFCADRSGTETLEPWVYGTHQRAIKKRQVLVHLPFLSRYAEEGT
ncbi:MAG: hypothetical protein IJ661_10840 [Lachnospiraceae bacterium]|nr:hypothetical protein [Lachnospiraceae bacterium]